MLKKALVSLLVLLLILGIVLPARASGPSIDYKIKMNDEDIMRYSQADLKKFMTNHDIYLLINNEPVPVYLNPAERDKLARGEKVAKTVVPKNDLKDGTYKLAVKHGTSGKVSEAINIYIKDGVVSYDRYLLGHRDTIFFEVNTAAPNPDESKPGGSLDWQDPDALSATYWGDIQPDDSIFSRMFSMLVQGIMKTFLTYFGLNDPVTLFFGVDPNDIFKPSQGSDQANINQERIDRSLYVDPEEGFLYTFNDKEAGMINTIFDTLSQVLRIPFVIGFVIIGTMMLLNSINADERTNVKALAGGLIMFPLMLKFFPYLLEPLFWLNYTLVRVFGSLIADPSVSNIALDAAPLTRPFVTLMIGSGTGVGSLGVLIGTLILFLLTALLNFQYFVRRVMLSLLIIMFPIVAFLQIFPGTRTTFRLWWSEFLSNLFLQSAHALVYVLFVNYLYNTKLPFIPVVAMLMSLNAMTAFVRSLLGAQHASGAMGMAGSILGISALMGAARIAGGVMGHLGQSGRYSGEEPIQARGGSLESTVPIQGEAGTVLAENSAGVEPASVETGSEVTVPVPESAPAGMTVQMATASAPTSVQDLQDNIGPMWGFKPRVPVRTFAGVAGKALAGTAIAAGGFAGAMLGGAAIGAPGIGLGAMIGTRAAGVPVRVAEYSVGIVNNYATREKILEDTIRKHPELVVPGDTEEAIEQTRQNAAVFAATGVKASLDEIQYDETMRQQYTNFMNFTGFESLHNRYKTDELPEKDVEEIRTIAARAREDVVKANPGISPQELNYRILEDYIRPEREKRIAAIEKKTDPGNPGPDANMGGSTSSNSNNAADVSSNATENNTERMSDVF